MPNCPRWSYGPEDGDALDDMIAYLQYYRACWPGRKYSPHRAIVVAMEHYHFVKSEVANSPKETNE
jgi:hypothetical protein